MSNKIKLKNGIEVEVDGYGWGAPLEELMNMTGVSACDVCPSIIKEACGGNNSFDCQVYGMFQGFYFTFDEFCRFILKNNLIKNDLLQIENKQPGG